MQSSTLNRMCRKWFVVCLMATTMVILHPRNASAACPFSGCDQFPVCMNWCDASYTDCHRYCQELEPEYRGECEDDCFYFLFSCNASCLDCEWCP